MRSAITVTVLFVTATVALPASAADLDKKQEGLLRRLGTFASNLQKSVEHNTEGGRLMTQRAVDDVRTKLAKLEADLATLPADNDAVKQEAVHFADVRKVVEEKAAATAASAKAADDKVEAFRALLDAPEFEADKEALATYAEMFSNPAWFAFDFYIWRRWPTHGQLAQMRGWCEAWTSTQKRFAEIAPKYEEVVAFRGQLGGQYSFKQVTIASDLRKAQEGLPAFKQALAEFAAQTPAEIEKVGAALTSAVDAAVAAKDFRAFTENEGVIEGLRYRLANLPSVWAPLAPSDEARTKVAERVAQLTGEADDRMEKLAELLIKENRPPKALYAGGDAKKLESYVRGVWATKFPKEAVVAVRLNSAAFERQVSWRWDSSAQRFVKSDHSTLPCWVIVKDGPKQAIMWFTTLYKLHLKGDELELGWSDRPSRGAPPDHRLLLVNL